MSSMLNLLRWNASGKATTLVVICHGVGADAAQMEIFVDAWAPSLPNVAFAAPDAPEPFEHYPVGHQWFSLSDRTPATLQAGAARASPLLDATIDAECTRLGLATGRVVLARLSRCTSPLAGVTCAVGAASGRRRPTWLGAGRRAGSLACGMHPSRAARHPCGW